MPRMNGGPVIVSLNDVYRKFGEASEAAQLLETELGTLLMIIGGVEANLLFEPNPENATEMMEKINRQTLGMLLKNAKKATDSLDHLESLLNSALKSRNRLAHSFYREHNFRRNSNEGRALMMDDLSLIHSTILDAFKAVMRLSGIDLDQTDEIKMPTGQVPIEYRLTQLVDDGDFRCLAGSRKSRSPNNLTIRLCD